ncbi:MAG: flagellar motor protein [Cyanobacteria bacterium]|jgi:flagellar motor protein MotB|nr:flagellar motor protein [Cyanobacteria bacterium GSL.Bin21]
MNPKFLKYSEIFSFLAFIFVIFFVLLRLDLLQTERVASQVPELEKELAQAQATADKIPRLQRQLAAARETAAEVNALQEKVESLAEKAEKVEELQAKLAAAEATTTEVSELRQQLAQARSALARTPDNPPIIILSEQNQRYRFAVGSAEISPSFQRALDNRIIPVLDRQSQQCECDAIEVIGHTDSLPVSGGRSNLDENLIRAFNQAQTPNLVPGSNLDLGMMRALSIIRYLKQAQREGELTQIKYFLPYSAGQMLKPNHTLDTSPETSENERRRRIEMRLLKSTAWEDQIGNNNR